MPRQHASKRMSKQISRFKYPIKESPKGFLERLFVFRPIFYSSKVSWLFHITMIVGIGGCLGMDLLFALTGFDHAVLEPLGLAYPFRFFHKWTMLAFIPVFGLYYLLLVFNQQLREGLERIDFVDFAILLAFVIYGVSYSWGLGLWGTYVRDFGVPENISDYTFHIVIPDSPIHALLFYVWVIVSLFGGGVLRKALANIILQISRLDVFPFLKKRHSPSIPETTSSRSQFYSKNFGINRLANLFACGKCGNCNDVCPVYQYHEDEVVAPRTRIRDLRKVVMSQKSLRARILRHRKPPQTVLEEMKQGVFMECTACGRCATVCPSGIDLPDLWLEARHSLQKSELAPLETSTTKEAIIEEKNIYTMDNEDRGMFFEFPDEEHADIAYFMGCLTSFSGKLEDTGQAVGDILNTIGEKWTVLREDEWCCGLPLELLGYQDHIRELARHNVERLEAMKVKKVVFNCPGCYKTFAHLYPQLLGKPLPFETQHVVELVTDALNQGQLKPKAKLATDEKFTYYDPCDLARYMGVYEEPRSLLRQLTTEFVELEENKNYTRCCGAGGGLRLVNNDMSREMAPNVIQLAKNVGATTLVTACPACIQMLGEVVAENEESGGIKVIDIVTILSQQFEHVDPPTNSPP